MMFGILTIVYYIIVIAAVTGEISILWLLAASLFMLFESILVLIDKTEKLTDFGKITFGVSFLGILYSLSVVLGWIPSITL